MLIYCNYDYWCNKRQKRAPFRRTKVKVVVHKQVRYDDIKDMQTNEVADMMFKLLMMDTRNILISYAYKIQKDMAISFF